MTETPETQHLRVRDPNPDTTAPQLVVELSFEIAVEQHVDIVAYFASFSESKQADFMRYVERVTSQGYGDYELPGNYLFPDDEDGCDIDGLPRWMPGVADPERIDFTGEFNLRVRLRQGDTQLSYSGPATHFGPDDFTYLRSQVPWLDEFFKKRESEDE